MSSIDYNRGYVHGYEKAYAEILELAKKNISKYDVPVKGTEGIKYTGPTGYVPDHNKGANGPQGPTAPTSWNVYDDKGNIVGVQGVINEYDYNYRRYM